RARGDGADLLRSSPCRRRLDHRHWKTAVSRVNAGDIPSADQTVQRRARGRPSLTAAERQLIKEVGIEDVRPFSGVGSIVQPVVVTIRDQTLGFLVVTVIVQQARQSIVGLKSKACGEPALHTEESGVVIGKSAVGAHPEIEYLVVCDRS